MSSAERQMREDRALRDAALALVKSDLAHVKSDFSTRGVGTRLSDRMREGAQDVFDQASDVATDHKGVLTALLAAVALWFARHPIASLFTDDDDRDEDDDW